MGVIHNQGIGQALAQSAPAGYYIVPEFQDNKATDRYFLRTKKNGDNWATFKAETLPGCCGVAVLSHVNVYYYEKAAEIARRNKVIVDMFVTAAKKRGYGLAMATQKATSAALPAYDAWEHGQPFNNGKTDNDVLLLKLDLKQPKRTPVKYIETGGE